MSVVLNGKHCQCLFCAGLCSFESFISGGRSEMVISMRSECLAYLCYALECYGLECSGLLAWDEDGAGECVQSPGHDLVLQP